MSDAVDFNNYLSREVSAGRLSLADARSQWNAYIKQVDSAYSDTVNARDAQIKLEAKRREQARLERQRDDAYGAGNSTDPYDQYVQKRSEQIKLEANRREQARLEQQRDSAYGSGSSTDPYDQYVQDRSNQIKLEAKRREQARLERQRDAVLPWNPVSSRDLDRLPSGMGNGNASSDTISGRNDRTFAPSGSGSRPAGTGAYSPSPTGNYHSQGKSNPTGSPVLTKDRPIPATPWGGSSETGGKIVKTGGLSGINQPVNPRGNGTPARPSPGSSNYAPSQAPRTWRGPGGWSNSVGSGAGGQIVGDIGGTLADRYRIEAEQRAIENVGGKANYDRLSPQQQADARYEARRQLDRDLITGGGRIPLPNWLGGGPDPIGEGGIGSGASGVAGAAGKIGGQLNPDWFKASDPNQPWNNPENGEPSFPPRPNFDPFAPIAPDLPGNPFSPDSPGGAIDPGSSPTVVRGTYRIASLGINVPSWYVPSYASWEGPPGILPETRREGHNQALYMDGQKVADWGEEGTTIHNQGAGWTVVSFTPTEFSEGRPPSVVWEAPPRPSTAPTSGADPGNSPAPNVSPSPSASPLGSSAPSPDGEGLSRPALSPENVPKGATPSPDRAPGFSPLAPMNPLAPSVPRPSPSPQPWRNPKGNPGPEPIGGAAPSGSSGFGSGSSSGSSTSTRFKGGADPSGSPSGSPSPGTGSGSGSGSGDPPTPTCRYKEDETEAVNVKVPVMVFGVARVEQQKALQVHEKMVDPTKLMFEQLFEIRKGIEKIQKTSLIIRVLNTLSTIASVHNMIMLSRNLATTAGDATSAVINAIGRISGVIDKDQELIDVNEIVGKEFNKFMEEALGKELWTGTKITWKKYSSIYSSASMMLMNVRSMMDSARSIAEWTAQNTGRIGNALKRFGVVGDNAYPWMSESVGSKNKFDVALDKYRMGVENMDDKFSSIESVAGESLDMKEESENLKEQKENFDKQLKEATPITAIANDPIAELKRIGAEASKGKETEDKDLDKDD